MKLNVNENNMLSILYIYKLHNICGHISYILGDCCMGVRCVYVCAINLMILPLLQTHNISTSRMRGARDFQFIRLYIIILNFLW